ncbi:MAG: MFS transporter [Gemmatimonadetes bacterium]|nr:MFS transporter [Gemmatimonadota bacterium]
MTAAATIVPAGLRPLDRVLRLFSDVRAGESTTALLLTLNIFTIFVAYYLMRPVREALILAVPRGPELKSYLSAGQVILLLGLVPLYGMLAGRYPRRRLINAVTAFFVACLVVFYVLGRLRVPIGVVFFLWIGIFNVMVIAQFWAFANDVYREEEGRRLFPIVAFGASAGAVLGSFVAGRLIGPLGVYQVLLFAGALLALSVALTNLVDERERRRTEAHLPLSESSAHLPAVTETGAHRTIKEGAVPRASGRSGGAGAFRLVLGNRYLLLIALVVLLLNWVNSIGEYVLGRTVSRLAADAVARGTAGGLTAEAIVGTFYANYQFGFNLGGLLLQLFLVSRILKYLGVGAALLVLPVIALAGYTLLAFYPILGVIRWAKTAENATDYSLNNTVRQVLFLPTTREQKYKAKQVVDSFCQRAGDVLQAGVVYVGTTYLALGTQQFAMVNLVLVAVWFVLAVLIGEEYAKRSRA